MKLKLAAAGLCAVLAASPTLAQTGGAGSAGAGQSGAGQTGAGQTGQPGTSQSGIGGQSGISQTPFFQDQAFRNQLRINQEQFNRLNDVYRNYWNRYRTGMDKLGKIDEQQRMQQLRALSGTFYRGFGESAQEVLNQEQQERFNQLYLQYQGPAALMDASVQKRLKLTDEQVQTLQKRGYAGLEDLVTNNATNNNRAAALKRYNELRLRQQEWMNNFLTQEQMQIWRQMTGEPYNFQPSATQPGQTTTTPGSAAAGTGSTGNTGSGSPTSGTPRP